jgi:four helix bundle protein
MDSITTHRDLKVWQMAVDLVVELYRYTENVPKSELFGLTSQIRRASVSIPSNIAEGASRKNTKEYIQFLYIALGSVSEIDTQIEIVKRLGFAVAEPEIEDHLLQVKKMLVSLIKTLQSKLT